MLCLIGLFNLSGCESSEQPCGLSTTFYVDGDTVDVSGNDIKLRIDGPDEIQPCLALQYFATAQGWNFVGDLSGAEWVASGGIQIDPSSNSQINPVRIIGTKDNGYGTLQLVSTAIGDCPGGKVLAETNMIVSFANTLDVHSTVCMDPVQKTGSGTLVLIDNTQPPAMPPAHVSDCVWSVAYGHADLEPQPDKVTCLVKNASGDFTIHCQVTNGKCSSDKPLTFEIKVPACLPQK
jgi:hypothetical protein